MFLFISCSYAKFVIQHSNTDMFISGDYTTETPIHLDKFENAVKFKFLTDDNTGARVYIAAGKNTNIAWRYDVIRDRLVFSPLVKERERTFKFIPLEIAEQKYWIASGDFCLAWKKNEIKFRRVICNINDTAQHFFVHEIEDVVMDFNYETMLENKRKEQEMIDLSHRNEKDGEILIGSIHKLIKNLTTCFDDSGVCKASKNFLDSFYAQSLVVAGAFDNVQSSLSNGLSNKTQCNCSSSNQSNGSSASSMRASRSSLSKMASSRSSSSGSSSSGATS